MHAAGCVTFDAKRAEIVVVHQLEFRVVVADEFAGHDLRDAFGRAAAAQGAIRLHLEKMIREVGKDDFVQNLRQNRRAADGVAAQLDFQTVALQGLAVRAAEIVVQLDEPVACVIAVVEEAVVCVVAGSAAAVIAVHSGNFRRVGAVGALPDLAVCSCHGGFSFRFAAGFLRRGM